jgi:hypothetical protein
MAVHLVIHLPEKSQQPRIIPTHLLEVFVYGLDSVLFRATDKLDQHSLLPSRAGSKVRITFSLLTTHHSLSTSLVPRTTALIAERRSNKPLRLTPVAQIAASVPTNIVMVVSTDTYGPVMWHGMVVVKLVHK